ncbi:MAG: HD domain-containing phosphohydrolase [Pseudomonadota bacterium]
MNTRVLLVDDDPDLLQGLSRVLRRSFEVEMAQSGKAALELIAAQEQPFAAVVADMSMPVMNGILLLQRVERASPDTVRLMLTGHADVGIAMKAVNDGHIFRFLTKPCPPASLTRALQEASEEYQRIQNERALLEDTFRGAIKVLTEVLAVTSPSAFGRTQRVHRLARGMMAALGRTLDWELDVAIMLCQLGTVAIPTEHLEQIWAAGPSSPHERGRYRRHPALGARLLEPIPRLEKVREIIRWQHATLEPAVEERSQEAQDGAGGEQGDSDAPPPEIPFGARLIKVALDFDALEVAGLPRARAFAILEERKGRYDPEVLSALRGVVAGCEEGVPQALPVSLLRVGMILREGVTTRDGLLIVARGSEITPALLEKLRTWVELDRVVEPLVVQTTAASSPAPRY